VDEKCAGKYYPMAEEGPTSNLGGHLFVDALATQACSRSCAHALVTFRENPVAGACLSSIAGEIGSRYIEDNLDQQLRHADLANALGSASPTSYGNSSDGSLCASRLRYSAAARSRTETSGKKPLAIMRFASIGFADHSTRRLHFKKYLRTTPGAYRNVTGR